MLKHHLNYQLNTEHLFKCISHLPWAIFLDSGRPKSEYGRYDILVADPFVTISTVETCVESSAHICTEVVQNGQKAISSDDPFAILNHLLAPYKINQNNELPWI